MHLPPPNSIHLTRVERDRQSRALLSRMRLGDRIEPSLSQSLSLAADIGARVFEVPICLVSTVDEVHQRVIGSCGLPMQTLEADRTPCAVMLSTDEPMLVNDASSDARLSDNPFVVGEPGVRFYAGVPLRDREGRAYGTLCLLDTRPRAEFGPRQMTLLVEMGRLLALDLEQRRQMMAERDLFADGPMGAVIWSNEPGWPLLYRSQNLAEVLGKVAVERLADGSPFEAIIDPRDRQDFRHALRSHSMTRLQSIEISYRLLTTEGPERWIRQISRIDDDTPPGSPVLRGYLMDESRQKRLESSMASTQERLHLAMESAHLGTFDHHLDRQERVIDSRAADILGYPLEEVDTHVDSWFGRVHPYDRASIVDRWSRQRPDNDPPYLTLEYRIRHRLGHYVWVQSYAKVVERDANGHVKRLVGTLLDITERKREEATRNRQRMLLDVLNRAQASFLLTRDMHDACSGLVEPLLRMTGSLFGFIGIVRHRADGSVYLVLPAVSNIDWQLPPGEPADGQADSLALQDLDHLFGRAVLTEQVVLMNDVAGLGSGGRLPPGTPPLDCFLGLPIRFNGRVTGIIGLGNSPEGYDTDLVDLLEPLVTTLGALIHARDLETARQRAEDELVRMASTDALTGLANRRRFTETAEAALARSARSSQPLALAVIDLDHFKCINDTHGHAVGDAVLRHVAGVMQAEVREVDLVARHGGEEFALLLHDTGVDDARRVMDRIRERLRERPAAVDGLVVPASLSAGLACHEGPGDTLDMMLARADEALYAAKEGGRNRVVHHRDLVRETA